MGIVPNIVIDESHPLANVDGGFEYLARLADECSRITVIPVEDITTPAIDSHLEWHQTANEILALQGNASDYSASKAVNYLNKIVSAPHFDRLPKALRKRVLYKAAIQLVTHGFMRDAQIIASGSPHPQQIKGLLVGGSLEKPSSIVIDFTSLKVYFTRISMGRNENFGPEQLADNYNKSTGETVSRLLERLAIKATPKGARL